MREKRRKEKGVRYSIKEEREREERAEKRGTEKGEGRRERRVR